MSIPMGQLRIRCCFGNLCIISAVVILLTYIRETTKQVEKKEISLPFLKNDNTTQKTLLVYSSLVQHNPGSQTSQPTGDLSNPVNTAQNPMLNTEKTRYNTTRILCWILTDPKYLERTKHVKATWAKRCDITLYMSSVENKTFPTIGLNVSSGRSHLASKSKAAWTYIHDHYLEKADFFVKADPDTFIIVENLRQFLSTKNASLPELYGHRFLFLSKNVTYTSGGAGVVLTKEALKRMVRLAFRKGLNCMPDGQGEDWKTANCLQQAGGRVVDTRDKDGRERFLPFIPQHHIRGRYPDWYRKMDVDKALEGKNCCSEYPVSFHYVKPDDMYTLEYLIYTAKAFQIPKK